MPSGSGACWRSFRLNQIRDAFRAAGYTPDQIQNFSAIVRPLENSTTSEVVAANARKQRP